MTNIVEVFWDASPALRRLGVKRVGSGAPGPKAEALFQAVKRVAGSAFTGAVTLVRIEVRRESSADLRIVRNGAEKPPSPGLRTMIEHVVEELVREPSPGEDVPGREASGHSEPEVLPWLGFVSTVTVDGGWPMAARSRGVAGAGAALRPEAGQRALLADPGLVLEPDLEGLALRLGGQRPAHQRGGVF